MEGNNDMFIEHPFINSELGKSSMMTFSKVICCICNATMEPNQSGMCETCFKNQIDISEGITKQALLHYCRQCDRYMKQTWVRVDPESQDLMLLCLSKVKGLNKGVKVIDTNFIWTEPHSKRIKIKLTIQKEVLNSMSVQKSFVIEFIVEWVQCDDCKKTWTPHIWNASLQIRQKVNHKKTFLYLEQLVLKHNAHAKAVNIKELPEGIDFYFQNKSQANSLTDFIQQYFPAQVKISKKLISHDQHSNIHNYKYSYCLEIAPVCKDDLIVLDKALSKELGGIGPILLCNKISSRIHLIDVMTLKTLEFDENTYWRHNFRSYIDNDNLHEFLIINVQEDIDYTSYKKDKQSLNDSKMSIEGKSTKANKSLNSRYSVHSERKDFKIVEVQCIRNQPKNENDGQLITVRSHLGEKMRPGDIYLGYDLQTLNSNCDVDTILENSGNFPDIILVKKKYNRSKKRRIWKLKHLDKDDVEMGTKKTQKQLENEQKQYEKFLEDIEEDKDMRSKINLYKDEDAIRELEEKMNNMNVVEKNDDEIDIKVEELLDSLTIHDNIPEKDQMNKEIIENMEKSDMNKKSIKIDKNIKEKIKYTPTDPNIIGKRDRDGNNID